MHAVTQGYTFRRGWGSEGRRRVRIEAASHAEAKELNKEAQARFVQTRIREKAVDALRERAESLRRQSAEISGVESAPPSVSIQLGLLLLKKVSCAASMRCLWLVL